MASWLFDGLLARWLADSLADLGQLLADRQADCMLAKLTGWLAWLLIHLAC